MRRLRLRWMDQLSSAMWINSARGSDDADAFRWTSSTGLVLWVPTLMAQWMYQSDSTVVVEQDPALGSTQFSEAFRWTAAEGVVWLGAIPGLTHRVRRSAFQAMDRWWSGHRRLPAYKNMRFGGTRTGLVDLGDLPGGGEIPVEQWILR